MGAPRFYSWDDTGSPGRNLSGNLQSMLKQILVPCLVTGYGSKPGAGWTLEHEHANGFALSNGSSFINFVSDLAASSPYPAMNGYAIHIYVAESMTGTDGPFVVGANVCSGEYRVGGVDVSPYRRHLLSLWPIEAQLSTSRWTVVADDKTAVISVTSASGTANQYYQTTLYFGDVDNDMGVSNRFVALGGDYANYNGNSGVYTLCGGFTAPRNQATGVAEFIATQAQPFLNNRTQYINSGLAGQVPGRVQLQQPRLAVGDGYAGRLRGVVYDDVLALHGWAAYAKALGFSGSDFTDSGKVVNVDGANYAHAQGYHGGFLMTDNVAFW
ncbi:MAG TPA: hypothetical protein DEP32_11880 [Pseudomonas sp.]|nr:hypothetical protein [Pseudomonas sp.]MBB51191.1 hypothetical protein [Pseudomonadales bacterium]MBB52291.1 hypothetical protein [Pseudomonadales bacterium]HCA24852.1 hypothetical protein [Pseudomonas sp.]|tara:strand:+ start:17210 stop:18190 length:981 start_codon:yes stop_codon:yes gene_type:complete